MATYTSRASLRKPQRGTGGNTDDIVSFLDDFNTNMLTIDDYLNFFPCLSTDLPDASERFTGMIVLETDTKVIRLWTGSQWDYVGDYKAPKGYVSFDALAADSANITTTATFAITKNFTSEANRRYALDFGFYIKGAANTAVEVNACWATGAVGNLLVGTNSFQASAWNVNAGKYGTTNAAATKKIRTYHWSTAPGGSVSVGMHFKTSGTVINVIGTGVAKSYVGIRDLGAET